MIPAAYVCGSGTSGQGRPRRTDLYPAPTITGMNTACVIDDPAEWQGPKGNRRAELGQGRQLVVEELSVLQGFPRDYPWQGTQSAQHQQLGNAVPPPLAAACMAAALGLSPSTRSSTGGDNTLSSDG